jgi:hypothetical protein
MCGALAGWGHGGILLVIFRWILLAILSPLIIIILRPIVLAIITLAAITVSTITVTVTATALITPITPITQIGVVAHILIVIWLWGVDRWGVGRGRSWTLQAAGGGRRSALPIFRTI